MLALPVVSKPTPSSDGILTQMTDDRARLCEVIRGNSLQIGDFTLTSGKKSPYYLDCRTTTLHPLGALLTARLMLQTIREKGIEAVAVGGLTLGADPIVAAIAVVSQIEETPIPAFIVRKEAKGHGAKRQIEGWQGPSGSRVIIVDDVCTSGGSMLEACAKVEEVGYEVVATMCVVDREEGGTGVIAVKYPFYPIFTAAQLLSQDSVIQVDE